MKSKTIFPLDATRHLSLHHHLCLNKTIVYQNDIVIIDVIGFWLCNQKARTQRLGYVTNYFD